MPIIRNLIYNCCAFSHSDEWLLNIRKLNMYSHVFNGRKLVIVRTGENIVEVNKVKETFAFDAEFIILPNSKELQEVSGFVEALEMLSSLNPDERTFYAHTKGVKYLPSDKKIPAIRIWRDTMYEACLGDIKLVDDTLNTFACCGPFFQVRNHPPKHSTWHFAGSFWWFNHKSLFSLPNWKTTGQDKNIYGTELYLGKLFSQSESFCLTDTSDKPTNLYDIINIGNGMKKLGTKADNFKRVAKRTEKFFKS